MLRTPNPVACWLMTFIVAAAPSLACAQSPVAAAAESPDSEQSSMLRYVTPGAALAAVAYPRRVLTHPDMQMMPIEIVSAAGKKGLGIDPLNIEQIVLIVEPPSALGPPGGGFVLRLTKPITLDQLSDTVTRQTEPAELEGRPYLRGRGMMAPSFYLADDKTLLVGTDATLRGMLASAKAPQPGELTKLLAEADGKSDLMAALSVDMVRPLLDAQMAQMPPVPAEFEEFTAAPNLISSIEIRLSITDQQHGLLAVNAINEAAADQLLELIDQAMLMARQQMEAEMNRGPASDDPVEQAAQAYARRVSGLIFDALKPQQDGARLTLSGDGGSIGQVGTIGVLVGLLLPAVQAAREAARRAQSMNNLRQIAIAMHMNHDAKKHFPARAIFDPQGKPLLSWRVHLLPFLEQSQLYEQFHLDEPWDSAHNRTLIDKMPQVYRNPSSNAQPGKANYLVPVGDDMIFEGNQKTQARQITDGTSNTLLVLEVDGDRAVIWTKPDDLEIDMKNPLKGLGNAHPGGFLAASADGSVRFLSNTIDPATFRLLLQKSDGQIVPQDR